MVPETPLAGRDRGPEWLTRPVTARSWPGVEAVRPPPGGRPARPYLAPLLIVLGALVLLGPASLSLGLQAWRQGCGPASPPIEAVEIERAAALTYGLKHRPRRSACQLQAVGMTEQDYDWLLLQLEADPDLAVRYGAELRRLEALETGRLALRLTRILGD